MTDRIEKISKGSGVSDSKENGRMFQLIQKYGNVAPDAAAKEDWHDEIAGGMDGENTGLRARQRAEHEE